MTECEAYQEFVLQTLRTPRHSSAYSAFKPLSAESGSDHTEDAEK